MTMVSTRDNLWGQFGDNDTDPEEVFYALRTLLGGTGQRAGTHKTKLQRWTTRDGNQNSEDAFMVGYVDKNRERPFINAIGRLKRADLDDLLMRFRASMQTQQRTATVAMAVNCRVLGASDYGRIRIRPVPNYADLVSTVTSMPPMSDEPTLHAFLVDVRYVGSPDVGIDGFRRRRSVSDAMGLVALCCWPTPRRTVTEREHERWALVWEPSAGRANNARLFLGFNHAEPSEATSPPAGLSMLPTIDEQSFRAGAIMVFDPLHVIETFGPVVAAFDALSRPQLRKARRALHWFVTALETPSPTLSVVAFAATIEALMLEDEEAPRCDDCNALSTQVRCPTCGASIEKLAARFKAFISAYAGDVLRDKFLKTLYSARSALVHGSTVYEVDEPFLGVISNDQVDTMVAVCVAQASLIKWIQNGGV